MARNRSKRTDVSRLLDLPENIFTKIFSYFEPHYVYFMLRNICRRINTYVDTYVQLEEIFFNPKIHQSSRTYFIFKRLHKVVSIYCKLSAPYPGKSSLRSKINNVKGYSDYEKQLSELGLIVINKVVAGALNRRCTKINADGYSISRLDCILHEYSPDKNIWLELLVNTRCKKNPMGCWENYCAISSCSIGNTKTLLLVRRTNYSTLLENRNRLLMLDVKMEISNMSETTNTCLLSETLLPDHLRQAEDFSMVNIIQNKILLIGSSLLMSEGTLNDEENDIHWLSFNCKNPKAFDNPTCFKLKDYVYIIRHDKRWISMDDNPRIRRFPLQHSLHNKVTCDKYNINTFEYHENVWPVLGIDDTPNSRRIGEPAIKVLTDTKETFAIMIIEKYPETTTVIFTEKEGFEYVSYHLDIPISP